jgi:SOS-response transcriptional repressor LexA
MQSQSASPSLSPANLRVLGAVIHLTRQHGRAPTLQQVATAVGLRAKSTICVHMKKLEAAGRIRRDYRHEVIITLL